MEPLVFEPAFKMDHSICPAKKAGKISRKDHFLCKEGACLFSFAKPCAIPDNELSPQLDFTIGIHLERSYPAAGRNSSLR